MIAVADGRVVHVATDEQGHIIGMLVEQHLPEHRRFSRTQTVGLCQCSHHAGSDAVERVGFELLDHFVVEDAVLRVDHVAAQMHVDQSHRPSSDIQLVIHGREVAFLPLVDAYGLAYRVLREDGYSECLALVVGHEVVVGVEVLQFAAQFLFSMSAGFQREAILLVMASSWVRGATSMLTLLLRRI